MYIYILTFYLTFFLAYTLTFFLAFCLASMVTFCLAFYLAFSLACVRVQLCPTASGAGDMVFGSWHTPQHPELMKEEEDKTKRGKGRRRRGGGGRRRRGRRRGLAPLLKSRDPHLAGGKNLLGSLRFFLLVDFYSTGFSPHFSDPSLPQKTAASGAPGTANASAAIRSKTTNMD